MRVTLIPRDETERRWKERPGNGHGSSQPQQPLNLGTVLDLGETVYFMFRGQTYGVPPLNVKAAEKILAAYLELLEHADFVTRESLDDYYRTVKRLQGLLWKHTRTVGRVRRLLRRLGLIRNPFLGATEGEVAKLAGFMLGRRMKSTGVQLPGAPDAVI